MITHFVLDFPGPVVQPEQASRSSERATRARTRPAVASPTAVPQLQLGQGRAREQRAEAERQDRRQRAQDHASRGRSKKLVDPFLLILCILSLFGLKLHS